MPGYKKINKINKDQLTPASQVKQSLNKGSSFNLADNRVPGGSAFQKKSTAMPGPLKSGIENLSGYSMDDVKVHYNSSKPAQLNAHAYAQGTEIHLGPGQEKHLSHEAWHVLQQKQGRVKPTTQLQSIQPNKPEGFTGDAPVQRYVNVLDYEKKDDELDMAKEILAQDYATKVVPFKSRLPFEHKGEILLGHGAAGKVDGHDPADIAQIMKTKTEPGNNYELTVFACQIGEVVADKSSFPQQLHDLMIKEKVNLQVKAPKKSIFVFKNKAYGQSDSNLWAEDDFKNRIYCEARFNATKGLVDGIKIPGPGDGYNAIYDSFSKNKNILLKIKQLDGNLVQGKKHAMLTNLLVCVKSIKVDQGNLQKRFKNYEELVVLIGQLFDHGGIDTEIEEIKKYYTAKAFADYYDSMQGQPNSPVQPHTHLDYESMPEKEKELWTISKQADEGK